MESEQTSSFKQNEKIRRNHSKYLKGLQLFMSRFTRKVAFILKNFQTEKMRNILTALLIK